MKKLLAIFAVFALLLPLYAGCQSAYAAQNEPAATAPSVKPEQALEIALTDAGLTREQVYDPEVDLDRNRDGIHYEVEFEAQGYEYEYEIHAETGEILRVQKERD